MIITRSASFRGLFEFLSIVLVLGAIQTSLAAPSSDKSTPPPSRHPTPAAPSLETIAAAAAKKAFNGGLSGAVAGVLQVFAFMWLRTTMNYQYRYGGSMGEALRSIYGQGGVARFYRGVGFALVEHPLSKFGDVAANAGMVALLTSWAPTQDLPLFAKTLAGSVAAASWRVFLMPMDTIKTTLQVEGGQGVALLREKVRVGGVGVLFEGAAATLGGTFVGHYPWFVTFNTLQLLLPLADPRWPIMKLFRNAWIGLCASGVSDCCANSFRVVKTTKQTYAEPISYLETIRMIVRQDGLRGLLGRGLLTRLLTNGLQGMVFSVVWKLLEENAFSK